ncbi:hypothetical protein AMS68_002971 [Peltaster fructicola]|uniref:Transcription initiation factor TFIID subunit 13 n=1 Tax=Peltaster fructicola TaxID=286661 RepID=A0A6H0XRU1_9PEZI|nr:hypothetical protein AMS68_002971 [Peltaster fructicola]
MAEPRARVRQRPFFTAGDLFEYLTAFAAPNPPHLPSTIAALDEILTDFIIETCHMASLCASYSRRQKIKVDDFKWALRQDERLLGRVQEQQWRDKKMKEERKGIDVEKLGAEGGVGDLAALAGVPEVNGEKSEGKRRGRKKRKAEDDAEGSTKRPRV